LRSEVPEVPGFVPGFLVALPGARVLRFKVLLSC
jgi:hypothetical protein